MTTVLLVRHGLTDANTGGTLAGWTPGVHLAAKGRDQVEALGQRLAVVPLTAIVSSPLERCQETAAALQRGRDGLSVETDDRLGECRYGDWQGQPLKTLAKDPLWKVVQSHPSAVTFPGGEALRDTQARAVAAIRDHNARLGADATWVAVSHGDVIKAILADALGLHLDAFQRIVVDPASVSVVTYTDLRPFVVRMNDIGGDLAGLIPPTKKSRRRSSDAAVGGGAGGAHP
ncbi:MAG TPA: histidine phosphatase family protein [Mycobacteriales bacterium]|jgi:probable phosphomutase (TIGR03848 family)|nr:histidine phosphatase family protein [Mycobacteriales bacterium]